MWGVCSAMTSSSQPPHTKHTCNQPVYIHATSPSPHTNTPPPHLCDVQGILQVFPPRLQSLDSSSSAVQAGISISQLPPEAPYAAHSLTQLPLQPLQGGGSLEEVGGAAGNLTQQLQLNNILRLGGGAGGAGRRVCGWGGGKEGVCVWVYMRVRGVLAGSKWVNVCSNAQGTQLLVPVTRALWAAV